MITSKSPLVILAGDADNLSLEILKRIKEIKFNTLIISRQIKEWKEKLVNQEEILTLSDFNSKLNDYYADYIICVCASSFLDRSNENIYKEDLAKTGLLVNYVKNQKAKILFVFSYNQNGENFANSLRIINLILTDKTIYSGIIFVGDIFGIDGGKETFLEARIKEAIKNSIFDVSKNFKLYPLNLQRAAEFIIKYLLSLKAYGKITACLGWPITAAGIGRYIKKFYPESFLNYRSVYEQILPKVQQKEYSKEKPKKQVLNAIKTVEEKKTISDERSKKLNNYSKGKFKGIKFKVKVNWKYLVTTLFLFSVITPLTIFLLSILTLAIGNKFYNLGNFDALAKQLTVSEKVSEFGEKYDRLFVGLPLIGKYFRYLTNTQGVLKNYSKISLKIINSLEITADLISKTTDSEEYNLDFYTNSLSLELNSLFQDLGFLEGEINNSDPLTLKISRLIIKEEQIKDLKNDFLALSKLAVSTPYLFGKNKPEKYLLLFQNNNTIRATGGIIDSFIIVTFSNGKIIDTKIYDVSSADKKLEGIVDPPGPLKEYFGINNWYLRDSNWDPDYSVSAAQAEWFLDKELDENVNGIISFNANFLKELVKEQGSVVLSDSNTVISFENILEFLNSEFNEITYPITNKENASTQILRKVFDEEISDQNQRLILIRTILNGLNENDIQLFSKDNNVRDYLNNLNWGDSFNMVSCSGNCYSDNLAIVESGIFGGSQNIERYAEFSVSLEEGIIKRKLSFFLENNNEDNYKTYIRVYTEPDSGFSKVQIVETQNKIFKDPALRGMRGFEEAGVYVEIPAKETKAVVFMWESSSENNYKLEGEYKLNWWKQPGIKSFPVKIDARSSKHIKSGSGAGSSLTNSGMFSYNTLLSQGFTFSLFWNKN